MEENKDKDFNIIEEDGIVIYDESDDYVLGEAVDDEDLNMEYCESHSTEVKPKNIRLDNIISLCVVGGVVLITILFVMYAFGRYVW